MSEITLYPNKFSYRDDEGKLHNESFEYIDRHLWSLTEVHQSVTIRTLMEIIRAGGLSFWQHALTEPLLPDLFEHYEENLLDHKQKSIFDYMLFHWHAEYWDWEEEEKNMREEICIGLDVSGFVENDPENPSGIYGLTLTPFRDMLNANIRIDKKFEVYLYGDKHDTENGSKISFGLRTPTLLELMKAFIFEATFLGTEEEKKEQETEMNRRIEDIKSGKSKGRTFRSVDEMREYLDNLPDDNEDDE